MNIEETPKTEDECPEATPRVAPEADAKQCAESEAITGGVVDAKPAPLDGPIPETNPERRDSPLQIVKPSDENKPEETWPWVLSFP